MQPHAAQTSPHQVWTTLDMTLLHCITAGQSFPCTGSVLLKPVACAALHIAALHGLALAGSGRYKAALRLEANGQKLKGAAKKWEIQ